MTRSPLHIIPFAIAIVGCPKSTEPVAQHAPAPEASSALQRVTADAAPPIDASDAAPHAQGCDVRVGSLTAANKYRGHRLTPADHVRLSRDPAQARLENGISHGAQHIECTFDVIVNGLAYSYKHHAQGGPYDLTVTEALCKTDEERAEVVAAIQSFTENCTDLHRGEYWGEVLVPSP